MYAAPEDCELSDRKAWEMANPALGLFLNENELIDGAVKAERMPSFENTLKINNFKEFKNFKNQLSNFKDNISEYLEEQYEDKNIDKNNMFIISKEFSPILPEAKCQRY